METRLRARVVMHGALVVLAGLLAGFPYASAVGDPIGERAWRMAHLEGVLNGMLMLVVMAVTPWLRLSDAEQRALARALMLAGWGNVIASVVGASFGVRGLAPALPIANLVVFALFMIAVLAVLLAIGLVALGAGRTARDGAPAGRAGDA